MGESAEHLLPADPELGEVDRFKRPGVSLSRGELAETTSLSPRSISGLEHLRRDNTMITTNTAAVFAKCYRTPRPNRGDGSNWLYVSGAGLL